MQSFILQKSENTARCTFQINGKIIEKTKSTKYLGLNIDNKLTFDDHIPDLYNETSVQLNAVNRLKRYLEKIRSNC